MKTKKAFLFFLILIFTKYFYSQNIYSSQQVLYSDNKLLELVEEFGNLTGNTFLINVAPVTVGELKLQLNKIDYEKLADYEKSLYDQIIDYFDERKWHLEWGGFTFSVNVNVTPELMFKSNPELDWSFATDYTGGGNYGAASDFENNQDVKKIVSIPIYLGWGDIFFIETEPYFTKNFWGFTDNWNFTNVVYQPKDMEFLFPSNAYFSAGKTFNNWGFNFLIAKEGLSIGRSQTGNVLYNSTFVTDCFFQMNLYCDRLKYNLNVAEVDHTKFLYLHYIDFLPWKWLRIGVLEGTLIQSSFELRYLNPIMIMHSFGSWEEYSTQKEKEMYGESHVCAYFGWDFDIVPCKNLRIYGAYAQNELQSFLELGNPLGDSMPDSFSLQLGSEFNMNALGGNWKASLEGVYSTPYSYIKQGADWSLYRYRTDMNSGNSNPICSWIGSPFGPDTIAAQAKVQYSQNSKWNAGLEYLFVVHGDNSFGLFNETWTDSEDNVWYKYYPSAAYKQGIAGGEDLSSQTISDARNHLPSGIPSFTNRITVRGFYKLNEHFSFDGAIKYSFVFNNKNIEGKFDQGVEMEVSCTWKLF